MASDIRQLLESLNPGRLLEICEALKVATDGTADEQRARLSKVIGADLEKLAPFYRAELVAFFTAYEYRSGDVVGRYLHVERAGRADLEKLLRHIWTGQPRATSPSPLGPASPIKFLRADETDHEAVAAPADAPAEKVLAVKLKREPGYTYYVKGGDIWAAPIGRDVGKRPTGVVKKLGLVTDYGTHVYFVDVDGDIARRRRDVGAVPDAQSPMTLQPSPQTSSKPSQPNDLPLPTANPPPPQSGPTNVLQPQYPTHEPLRVFIAYSHVDKVFLTQLRSVLAPYVRGRKLDLFADIALQAGQIWEAELHGKLERADMVMLLVSSDFLNSNYCMDIELPRALTRMSNGECEVVPIIIRDCRFELTVLGKIQSILPNDKPLDENERRDSAWVAVTRALDPVINRILAKRAT